MPPVFQSLRTHNRPREIPSYCAIESFAIPGTEANEAFQGSISGVSKFYRSLPSSRAIIARNPTGICTTYQFCTLFARPYPSMRIMLLKLVRRGTGDPQGSLSAVQGGREGGACQLLNPVAAPHGKECQ